MRAGELLVTLLRSVHRVCYNIISEVTSYMTWVFSRKVKQWSKKAEAAESGSSWIRSKYVQQWCKDFGDMVKIVANRRWYLMMLLPHLEEVLSLIEPKLPKMVDTQLRILLDDAHDTLHLSKYFHE